MFARRANAGEVQALHVQQTIDAAQIAGFGKLVPVGDTAASLELGVPVATLLPARPARRRSS